MTVSVQYSILGETASAIAASVEQGAREGGLVAGGALPTVRSLAEALSVSPATVAAAYRLLKMRGIVATGGRRGTRLSHRPPLATRPTPAVPSHLRNLAEGNPDPKLLPSLRQAVRRIEERPRLYGEATAQPALVRRAAREMEADGVPAAHLAIVGGALDGIERVLQARLRPGDRVAVEDPGYTAVFDLLSALGLVAEPVAIDDRGMLPGDLARALATGAAACVVTPRAQNPTGAALDAKRVRELRVVLDAYPETLLIEDDHAGPVAGSPALTLVRPKGERWAVVRSVSKSLGPDLRLAVLAGDALTVARVEGRRALGAGWVSFLLQGIVERLWSDPATLKRLAVAADAYRARREGLIQALAERGIAARGASGLNVWIPVPEEGAMLAHLAAAGWAVRAGERYRLRTGPAIRVTVANLRPSEAAGLARDIAQGLVGAGRGAVA
jgi:DNA-binding transcriptional MocR family regulator